MPESVLTILKFCFLALLYLFLFRVVRVVVKEMRAPAPVPEQPAAPPSAAPVSASQPPKPAKGRGPGRLRILEPPARHGESFALSDELTVGRGGGCSIVLADLGSMNGTLVNGTAVKERVLHDGDEISVGATVMRFEAS